MESYLMWELNITVEDLHDANESREMAEILGNVERRPHLSAEQFAPIVEMFELYREQIEHSLSRYNEEYQSWRDYAGYAFDFIPEDLIEQARAMIAGCEAAAAVEADDRSLPEGCLVVTPENGTFSFLGATSVPAINFVTLSTHAYNWRPLEDMTAYELALCLPIFFTNFGWPRTEAIDALPGGAKRHFERVEGGG